MGVDFFILVFVCNAAVSIENCDDSTARAVFRFPVQNVVACNKSIAGQTGARTIKQEDEYLVTKCVREKARGR